MARLWHHPSHAQHELWGVCHQQLQAPTLTQTHQNFTHYLNHLTANKAHKSVISQFHIPYRMIAFAHNQQKKDSPQVSRQTNQRINAQTQNSPCNNRR